MCNTTRFLAMSVRSGLAVSVAIASLCSPARAQYLVQKALPDGCVRNSGGLGCSTGFALENSVGVTVSPDGNNVYGAASGPDAITIFDRNTVTGVITQKAGTAGCISETGSLGTCVDGRGLLNIEGIAVAASGTHVYTATYDGVAAFSRNLGTGALTQLAGTDGCVTDDGNGGECVDGVALLGGNDILVSPDGNQVYASCANSNSVVIFDRNSSTGVLTQKAGTAACISETGNSGACVDGRGLLSADGIAISPDGENVYVATATSNGVAIFDRDTGTGVLTQKAGTAGCITNDGSAGECTVGKAMAQATNVIVSPDGASVYVTSGGSSGQDAIAVFSRDLGDGSLTQLPGTDGCVAQGGLGGQCGLARGIVSPFGLDISSDGLNVYTASEDSNGVATFDRDPLTSVLTQAACPVACQNDGGSNGCLGGTALGNAYAIALSADDSHAYVAAEASDAIAVFDRSSPDCTTTTSTTTTTTLPPLCPASPRIGCQDATGGRVRIAIGVAEEPAGDKIQFVWRRGEATDLADLGNPVDGPSEVRLCVYDASVNSQPLVELAVPPGGTCRGRPCWRPAGKRGFRFQDNDQGNYGTRTIVLKAGDSPLAPPKTILRSRGAGAPIPALPLTTPVTAQLVVTDGVTEQCWEGLFTSPRRSSDKRFEAVGP